MAAGLGHAWGLRDPPPSPCPAPAHPPGGAAGWERGLIQHRAVGTRGCWAGRAVPHGGAELLGGTGVAPGWGHRAGGPCWELRWPCSGAVIWGAGCGALPISPKFPLQQQQEVSPWLCAVPGTLGTLCHGAAASLLHPAVAVALAPWHPGVLVPVQALGCCESAGAVSQGRVAPLVPGCPRGPGHAGCEGGGPQGSAPRGLHPRDVHPSSAPCSRGGTAGMKGLLSSRSTALTSPLLLMNSQPCPRSPARGSQFGYWACWPGCGSHRGLARPCLGVSAPWASCCWAPSAPRWVSAWVLCPPGITAPWCLDIVRPWVSCLGVSRFWESCFFGFCATECLASSGVMPLGTELLGCHGSGCLGLVLGASGCLWVALGASGCRASSRMMPVRVQGHALEPSCSSFPSWQVVPLLAARLWCCVPCP